MLLVTGVILIKKSTESLFNNLQPISQVSSKSVQFLSKEMRQCFLRSL